MSLQLWNLEKAQDNLKLFKLKQIYNDHSVGIKWLSSLLVKTLQLQHVEISVLRVGERQVPGKNRKTCLRCSSRLGRWQYRGKVEEVDWFDRLCGQIRPGFEWRGIIPIKAWKRLLWKMLMSLSNDCLSCLSSVCPSFVLYSSMSSKALWASVNKTYQQPTRQWVNKWQLHWYIIKFKATGLI